jgi:1,4-alpha-glucan branching enzyme
MFAGCSKDDKLPSTVDQPQDYVQYGSPMLQVPQNDDIVMYEVNLRAFSAQGDLEGVRSRLDEIKSLGTNVIWLMPIFPVGIENSINSPYCVKDFKSVGAEYGTLEDLRNLTTQAHAKGMTVILDWVANHTSWDHPWIQNPGWHTRNNAGQIIHPPGTNWLDVADLNFNNQDMRTAMIDAMRYWILEANVDGFRCDYADGVPFSFWQEAITKLRNTPNRRLIMFAEGERADHFSAGFDLNFGWNFYSKLKSVWNGENASNLMTTHQQDYTNVPTNKHILRFTTNHDDSAWDATPISLFQGKKGALAASVATIYMGGVPLFYSGQEVGRAQTLPFFSNVPINWNENPDMLLAYQKIMIPYKTIAASRNGVNSNFSNNQIICFQKTIENQKVLVIVNARNQNVNFMVPNELQNTTWRDTQTESNMNFNTSINLEPFQYLILSNSF